MDYKRCGVSGWQDRLKYHEEGVQRLYLVDNCTFWKQSIYGIYYENYGTEVGGKFIVGGTGIYLAPHHNTAELAM